ncbi:hypothetical protein SAMN06265795_101209 [Noviherbaspirillum humi]|uniref:Uncharacterized protein n=1 Tax=Noviherbaspirillum humi TaxID=1688639 RepID=A0A239C1F6_9BURK|nr:hypothetical protein [Noviherbaspirillum humi]SNS14077.1 hypothetical protein SAMN06265795_101209 [Noviherbaspirillum humi]
MAAITYTKGDKRIEADIQRLAGGKYQGVVLITGQESRSADGAQHLTEALSDSPEEALEEAKALAHRLLDAH